jgi:N-acetylglucosaminyldiphosphoundecaprenol N-acetyl-beta-D-mannosaminyltransferase
LSLANTSIYPSENTERRIQRLQIGYASVCTMTFAEALNALVEHACSSPMTVCVVTPNAQHIVLLEKDAHFRRVYDSAEYVLPDGASLLLAARLLGQRLKERIAGVDLFQALCMRAAESGIRVFLLGGLPGSAAAAAKKLQSTHHGLQIAGIHVPPLGFENNPVEIEKIAAAIRSTQPQLLFVGLGAPKQEYWIQEHGRRLGIPVCVGVGGSFEMVSGTVRRAPEWLQSIGMEWLFRLAMEPKRLWKRYLVGNLLFLWIVVKQMAGAHESMQPNPARSQE